MATDPADINYLRLTDHLHWEAELVDLRYPMTPDNLISVNPETAYSPDLTPERALHWEQWLQTYGCYAVSYHATMDLSSHTSIATQPGTSTTSKGDAAATDMGNHGASTGYELVGTDQQVDMELGTVQVGVDMADSAVCSVCLLPFDTVSSNAAPAATGSIDPSSTQGDTNSITYAPAPATPTDVATVIENNNIIVRYPCRGRHYFHAHCLHSWLQVSSARYLNSRRNIGILADSHLQVTCPCCREHPQQAVS